MTYRTRLTAQQRQAMERDGYLLAQLVLDETVIGRIRTRLQELVRQTVAAWDADPNPDIEEAGVVHAKPSRTHSSTVRTVGRTAEAGMPPSTAGPADTQR